MVGTRWVYRLTHAGPGKPSEADITLVVTAVERKDAEVYVTVGTVEGDTVTPYETVKVSGDGLHRVRSGADDLDPPVRLLKLPHTPGDEWDAGFRWRKQTFAGTRKAHEAERVVVPAGTFHAVRLTTDYTLAGKPRRATAWYAPEVGEVKFEDDSGGRELKSFTVGKK